MYVIIVDICNNINVDSINNMNSIFVNILSKICVSYYIIYICIILVNVITLNS